MESTSLNTEGEMKDVVIDAQQMSKEAFDAKYNGSFDYDKVLVDYPVDESFDPSAEPTEYDELMDIYHQVGEQGLADALGLSPEQLDQEISELAHELDKHADDDRDELIHQIIDDTVSNADTNEDVTEGAETRVLVDVIKKSTETFEVSAMGLDDAAEKAERMGYEVVDARYKDTSDEENYSYLGEASDCDETCPKSCPDCGGTGVAKKKVDEAKMGTVDKKTLQKLIDDVMNFSDPDYSDYYDDDADERLDIALDEIEKLAGKKVRNQVAAGTVKKHWGRPNHNVGYGYDRMDFRRGSKGYNKKSSKTSRKWFRDTIQSSLGYHKKAMKGKLPESVEQVDEVSKGLKQRYITKAKKDGKDKKDLSKKYQSDLPRLSKEKEKMTDRIKKFKDETGKKHQGASSKRAALSKGINTRKKNLPDLQRDLSNRSKGIGRATRALSKAEVEQVDENKLLKVSKLSSAEYQKAKKLKGFDKSKYKWDAEQQLYLKESYPMAPYGGPEDSTNVNFSQTKNMGDATVTVSANAKSMEELAQIMRLAGLEPEFSSQAQSQHHEPCDATDSPELLSELPSPLMVKIASKLANTGNDTSQD